MDYKKYQTPAEQRDEPTQTAIEAEHEHLKAVLKAAQEGNSGFSRRFTLSSDGVYPVEKEKEYIMSVHEPDLVSIEAETGERGDISVEYIENEQFVEEVLDFLLWWNLA